MNKPSPEYLEILLRYYEEEVSGDVYFRGLSKCAEDEATKKRFEILADVETYAAKAVEPLIAKYGLTPKSLEELTKIGDDHTKSHSHYDWPGFLSYMNKRFPAYIDEFLALENMAPDEDLPYLKSLTDHEYAVIDFGILEVEKDPKSMEPMLCYLAGNYSRQ